MKRRQKNGESQPHRHRCALCNQTKESLYFMKQHILRHVKVKPVQCPQCSYRSTTNGEMKEHIKVHTKENKYLCPHCGFFTTRACQFKRHLVKHAYLQPYTCPSCGLLCLSSSDLKAHEQTHSDFRPFRCDKCSFACKRAYHFKRHLLVHATKNFPCGICSFAGSTKYSLKYHMYKHSGEKPYRCRLCYYSCNQSTSLKVHMKKHHKERMYSCPQCDDTFDRKVELISHQRTHTDSGIKLELGTWFKKRDSNTDKVGAAKLVQISENVTGSKLEKTKVRDSEQDDEMRDVFNSAVNDRDSDLELEKWSGKRENVGQEIKEEYEDVRGRPSIKEYPQEKSESRLENFVKLENKAGSQDELDQSGLNRNANNRLENGHGLILRIKEDKSRTFLQDEMTVDQERTDQSNCLYFKCEEVDVSRSGISSMQMRDGCLYEHNSSPTNETCSENEVREICMWNIDVGNCDTTQTEDRRSQGNFRLNENQSNDSSPSLGIEEPGKSEFIGASLTDQEFNKAIISDSVVVKEEEEIFTGLPRGKNKRKKSQMKKEERVEFRKRKKEKHKKDKEFLKRNIALSLEHKKQEVNNNQTLSDSADGNDGLNLKQERDVIAASVSRVWKRHMNEKSFIRTDVSDHKCTNIFKELIVDRFRCTLCNTKLDRREHMVRHLDNHARGVRLACWLCPVVYFCRASLKKHEKTHRGADNTYHCSLCSFSHVSPKQLKIHSFSHGKINAFYCTDCSYATHWKENLKRHIQVNHTKVKAFLCSDCGEGFFCKTLLQRHLMTHEAPLVCQECGYFTHFRSAFNVHLTVHSQNKPFACDHCPFRTKRAWHLNRHKLVHETRKRYLCPCCSFSANQASTIKTHLYKHTGEFPFTCHLCGYACRQSSSLKTHLKTWHQEHLYQCDMCGFSTNLLLELRGHKLSHAETKL